jgi:hypothetical protein
MKNIIITSKDLKRELIIWLFCLLAAIGINIYAIIYYQTSWNELYSQGGYVIALSIFIYAIAWIFRGISFLIRHFTK